MRCGTCRVKLRAGQQNESLVGTWFDVLSQEECRRAHPRHNGNALRLAISFGRQEPSNKLCDFAVLDFVVVTVTLCTSICDPFPRQTPAPPGPRLPPEQTSVLDNKCAKPKACALNSLIVAFHLLASGSMARDRMVTICPWSPADYKPWPISTRAPVRTAALGSQEMRNGSERFVSALKPWASPLRGWPWFAFGYRRLPHRPLRPRRPWQPWRPWRPQLLRWTFQPQVGEQLFVTKGFVYFRRVSQRGVRFYRGTLRYRAWMVCGCCGWRLTEKLGDTSADVTSVCGTALGYRGSTAVMYRTPPRKAAQSTLDFYFPHNLFQRIPVQANAFSGLRILCRQKTRARSEHPCQTEHVKKRCARQPETRRRSPVLPWTRPPTCRPWRTQSVGQQGASKNYGSY